ncbi:MAG: phage GP46 family protein [Desulfurivibrionaceae bacterium]
MSDIRLAYKEISGAIGVHRFDVGLTGPDLATDDGLETAVLVSLFTDRRAEPDDRLPDGSDDRRGWWGDTFADQPNDLIGSRLWLLCREKQTSAVVERAREYAKEALAWLIADGAAKSVTVEAEIATTGVLALAIEIERPDTSRVSYRYSYAWEALANAV